MHIDLLCYQQDEYPLTIIVPEQTVMTITDHISGLINTRRTIVLVLKEGSFVRWDTHHAVSNDAQITTDLTVMLAVSAQFTAGWVQTGGTMTKTTLIFELFGAHAQARMIGRLTGDGTGQHTYTALQLHKAPDTKSFVELKAVLADASRLRYEGTITIEETGDGSCAHQEQKNLIVGECAQVTSIPNLQVLTNDVQCGHGSAVSYLNEEHLFYLQSRGIDLAQAGRMIIQGFLSI